MNDHQRFAELLARLDYLAGKYTQLQQIADQALKELNEHRNKLHAWGRKNMPPPQQAEPPME